MNTAALIALLPVISIAVAAVAVMLAIAVARDRGLGFRFTIAGLIVTLMVLPPSLAEAPRAVTGLLRIDAFALLFGAAVTLSALFVALLGHRYFQKREREEFYILLLTATLGGMLLAASTHFAMLFLGLEILSVSLFPLIAFRSTDRASLEAGTKYLILSGISSALLLFGMALIYGATGKLWPYPDLAGTDPSVLFGMLLLIAGLGFKLSLVPFHLWTPDVYQGSPAPVAAFVATVSKASVFAVLLRLWTSQSTGLTPSLMMVLGGIAGASILFGNLLALLQNNLKRLLGYSSIAHMGYALAALVAGSRLNREMLAEAVTVYLLAYLVTNLIAFGVVSVMSEAPAQRDRLDDYRGLFWRAPGLASALIASLLSLAGIPLTVGFIGKFYVFAVSTNGELWTSLALVVIGSSIGLYYYLRVILTLLQPAAEARKLESGSWLLNSALALLVLGLLTGGLIPEPLLRLIQETVKTLV